jgi:predicted DNA-binding helix-hairpin-helix protein
MVSILRSYRDMEIDLKLAWALEHREQFPVDLNRAPRELLLRIPGIGPRTADRLLHIRRQRPIGAADLRKLPVNWSQLRYFVATSDHRPRQRALEERQPLQSPATARDPASWSQLALFDAATPRQ